MVAQPVSADSVRLDVGDTWPMTVLVTSDSTGYAVSATVVAAVTDPAAAETTPTVTTPARGIYQAVPTVDTAGRWTATFDVEGHGVVVFAADVLAVVLSAGMPTVAQAVAYLGETSWTEDEITGALAAERAAQAAVCRIPATYPADLAQALLRRLARNLAARAVPVATFTSFEGGGTSTRVPMTDPEVARLERPWRRLVMG